MIYDELGSDVPSGLVEQHDNMGAPRHLPASAASEEMV